VIINLVPFISELIGMLVVVFLVFGQLGINFFGGNINSSTPKFYEEQIGRKLPENY